MWVGFETSLAANTFVKANTCIYRFSNSVEWYRLNWTPQIGPLPGWSSRRQISTWDLAAWEAPLILDLNWQSDRGLFRWTAAQSYVCAESTTISLNHQAWEMELLDWTILPMLSKMPVPSSTPLHVVDCFLDDTILMPPQQHEHEEKTILLML